MNVIYIKSPDSAWIEIASILKKKNNWNNVGWIGQNKYKKFFDKFNKDKNANYFSHELFMSNNIDYYINQNIDVKNKVENTLKKIKFHIPIIYEQINRWYDFAITDTKKLKKLFLNKIILDVIKFIEFYKIDMVICPTIPHRIYDYIFYVVLLTKDKPFLMVENTSGMQIKNNKLKILNFGIYNIEFRTNFLKNTKIINEKEFDKDTTSLLEFFGRNQNSIKYSYILEQEKFNSSLFYKNKLLIPKVIRLLASLIKRFLNGNFKTGICLNENSKNFCKKTSILRNFSYKLLIHKESKKALNFYIKNSITTNFPNKCIYFAASRHPERSHCPDGGLFFDPLRILTKLSKNIPKNYYILYKEHPNNFSEPYEDFRKNVTFYKNLLDLKNIIFVDHNIHSNELIDSSDLVATCTGTVGFEASIRGKQSVIFGSCWYEQLGSVKRLNNSYEIKEYFNNLNILSEDDIKKEIYLFLNKIHNHLIDLSYRRNNLLESRDNSSNLYFKKLEQIADLYYKTLKLYEITSKS